MSWLGDFGDLQGTLGAEGAQSYARGAIIGAAARAGWSANQTLGALRSAGLGFRRADFLRAYGAVVSGIQASQTASSIPLEAIGTPGGLPEPPANWTGQYLHQVTVTFRQPGEGGQSVILTRTMGIKSAEVLSPFEAAQAALGIIETPVPEEEESGYPSASQVVSVQLTGLWHDTRGNLAGGLL